MSRRSWSPKQDQAILILVEKHGTKSWSAIAHDLSMIYKYKQRTGKQCRQRYHNHLDPKISKRVWTIEQQQIMFRMHKVYGNKWTVIAQQLQGRSDNTIKNHFYSTIRRSLRRMSKLVGQKNSTKQLKYIKPSTLSKIFAINTKPVTQEQIQEQKRKCQQNQSYKRLVDYLTRQCGQLNDVIMQFSTFKPKGKNCIIAQQKRGRFQKVLQKMQRLKFISQLYELMRKEQRKLSSLNRPILDDDSNSQQSSSLQMQQQYGISMKSDEKRDREQQGQNQLDQQNNVLKQKKNTRSRRQIRVPKKYYQTAIIQTHNGKKKNKLKQMNKVVQKLEINQNKQISKSNTNLNNNINHNNQIDISNQKRQQIIFGNDNINGEEQQYQHNDQQINDQLIINNYCQPQFQISLIHPGPSELQHFPTPHLHLAQTPTYSLPTSFYLNTPALQLYQTPPNVISTSSRGLFSHIQGSWNIRNGQLDDMVISLGSQIAKNTSQLREKDDGKTIVSNINCSPNSAFRTCQ